MPRRTSSSSQDVCVEVVLVFPLVFAELVVSPVEVAFERVQATVLVRVRIVRISHRLYEVVSMARRQSGDVVIFFPPNPSLAEAHTVEGLLCCSLRISDYVTRVFPFVEEPFCELLACVLVVELLFGDQHRTVLLWDRGELDLDRARADKPRFVKWIIFHFVYISRKSEEKGGVGP